MWKLDPASLFEVLGDAVVVADATVDHPIAYVNAAFERLSGWQRGDVVGKPATQVIPSRGDREHPFAELARSREARVHGRTIRAPMRHRAGYEVDV